MKKIVFVEKQQSSTYDPVSTFFANSQQINNKKSNSIAKPSLPNKANTNTNVIRQTGSIERPPSTKNVVEQKKVQEKPITGKIGRKGDYIPPKQMQAAKKQQAGYGVGSKKNIRSLNQQISKTPQKNVVEQQQRQQAYFPNVNQKRSPIKPPSYPTQNQSYQQPPYFNTQPHKHNPDSQLPSLRKRIKQLQQSQQHLLQKLQQLQPQTQKLIKTQQKLQKLQKQHKQCSTDTKQTIQKLKQKQQQLRTLLQKQQIPYNKKRQMLLQNQINQLKRINRQLTTRIKNYRGTDLVQVSVANNKTDILYKEYDHSMMVNDQGISVENEGTGVPDFGRMESLVWRVVVGLEGLIGGKLERGAEKGQGWVEEKKIIMELNSLCKQLSMQSLSLGWKIPQSNKTCINIYNEIQKYRHKISPLLSKSDLNLRISQQNIDLINTLTQQSHLTLQLKQKTAKHWQEQKKFKKVHEAASYYLQKYREQTKIYEKMENYQFIVLAHFMAQLAYVEMWVGKTMGAVREGLLGLGVRLREIRELGELGDNGKEMLAVYVRNNIGDLQLKVPQLQARIKEIGGMFKGLKPTKNK